MSVPEDPAVMAKSYCVSLVCFEKCPLGEAGLVLFGLVMFGLDWLCVGWFCLVWLG